MGFPKWSKIELLDLFMAKNVVFYLDKTVLRNVKVKNMRLDTETGELKELIYVRENGKPGYLRAERIVNFDLIDSEEALS